ncbi:kinetochore Sim4 complex subunit Fta4 [Aspergillus ambiguus]|uniref:kinetochore subunit FTA4 family protein n=1 Tax=Aspergillus ambiguus TaxID=176160 RepID=UPI003CCD6EB0
MDSTRTVSELKSSFIRAQVRILSESLNAPEDWRNYVAERTEEEDLSDKVVGDALQKLNASLKQHNRIVYSSQAIQHVAQQIASLYWSSVIQAARDQNSLERGVPKSVDLSSHMNITQLPVELADESASDEERRRYQQLRERLMELDHRRQQRQRRLDQLQRLERLLEPFQNPQENIQPNLVTRDGELVQELEKMRMLVARVGGRIHQSNKRKRDSHADQPSYPLPGSDEQLETLFDMA